MPSAQEEQVNANLDLLLQGMDHLLGDDDLARMALAAKVDEVREQYATNAALAKDDKWNKDVGDAVAKALPAVTKGTLAAVEAFRKGDAISGSAALMDICAGVIPVLTSLFSASGPAGALVGALFSVVGQLLSFFAPKQPSLTDKIQEMLDHAQSEAEVESVTAFGYSVSAYASTLRRKSVGVHSMSEPVVIPGRLSLEAGSAAVTGTGTSFRKSVSPGQWLTFDSDPDTTAHQVLSIQSETALTLSTNNAGAAVRDSPAKIRTRNVIKRGIAEILAMPLRTQKEADDFLVEMYALDWGLGANQTKLDTPVFEHRKVSAYLTRAENQKKSGWPEVLGIWCRTYIDLLTANTMLSCLADPTAVEQLLEQTGEDGSSPLRTEVRGKCHDALLQLKALLRELRDSWTSDNVETLKIVRAVTPAAKERGLYAHLGSYQGSRVLYVARGDGTKGPLSWDYKKNTAWIRSISVHVPTSQRESFTPKYDVVVLKDGGTEVLRHTLDSVTGVLSDATSVFGSRGGERFLDVSGIALNDPTIGIDSGTRPESLLLLSAENDGRRDHYINVYTVDPDLKGTRVSWEPPLSDAVTVSQLYLPATPLADDPDADALSDAGANPPGPALVQQNTPVQYAGVLGRNAVHVIAWNSWAAVEGPQSWSGYNGLATDPHRLWLFGRGGIACVTHASLVKCRQGKIARPAWTYHDFPAPFVRPEVRWLSPSADGTLFVALEDESYTADYVIDRAKNRIVTSSWVKRGGQSDRVVKMPIPCWGMLESLRSNLQSTT